MLNYLIKLIKFGALKSNSCYIGPSYFVNLLSLREIPHNVYPHPSLTDFSFYCWKR